jgi:glycosyltransferase involved in cell wall biosynthesis
MNICYFGDFDPNYPRNRVIMDGLKANGANVTIVHTDRKGLSRIRDLSRKLRQLNGEYDVLIVGYSDSRLLVPLAWLIAGKKIVWDAFYSLYDSWVFDRKYVSPRSLKALYLWILDWVSAKLSDTVLLDTDAHADYFAKEFGIDRAKLVSLPVGADDRVFKPAGRAGGQIPDRFTIYFRGKYIPLQGVEFIIRAAKILESDPGISFTLVGDGQTYDENRRLAEDLKLKNIEFVPRLPYEDLPASMRDADVCLGIFGLSDKAFRVVPNKVYEAIAMGKAVITSDTPAIREIFEDGKNILLCKRGDAEDLARKISLLKNDSGLRERIAEAGHTLFKEKYTPDRIGKYLLGALKYDTQEGRSKAP